MIKAPLSWNLKDYLDRGEEPLPCVLEGVTEGQAMDQDDIETWARDNIRYLSVFQQEYPDKFEEQFCLYKADLDYLHKIGKINSEQKENLSNKDNFKFGQE